MWGSYRESYGSHAGARAPFPAFPLLVLSHGHDFFKHELSPLRKKIATENSYVGPQRARSGVLSGLQKQGITLYWTDARQTGLGLLGERAPWGVAAPKLSPAQGSYERPCGGPRAGGGCGGGSRPCVLD